MHAPRRSPVKIAKMQMTPEDFMDMVVALSDTNQIYRLPIGNAKSILTIKD